MNELVVQKGGGTQVPQIQGFNFFDPEQFATMQRMSNMFSSSELVPDMYKAVYKPIPQNANEDVIKAVSAENDHAKNKAIANCMIALEIAGRIGASPLMVMQNLVIIYGRPTWSSKFLIGTVNTCGRFNPLQYEITNKGMVGMVDYVDYVWDSSSRTKKPVQKTFDGTKIPNLECVAFTTSRGSDKILRSSPISIELAIKEGWYTKNGSKWQTMPEQMLRYRAASFWTNAYAPEISMGMRTTEEVQDIEDVTFEELSSTPKDEIREQANKGRISMGNVEDVADEDPEPSKETPKAEDPQLEKEESKTPDQKPLAPGF